MENESSTNRKKRANLNKSENIIFIKEMNIKHRKKKNINSFSKPFFNPKKLIILLISLILILLLILILILILKGIKYFNNKEKISFNLQKHHNIIKLNPKLISPLRNKLNETYEQLGFVNINEIESEIPGGRKWLKNLNKSKEVNLGLSLDSNYTLRAMLTIASAMDSQFIETKLRLHFAVVKFSVDNMLKIYSLREKIRDDVEFNFYNAKKLDIDLPNFHPKGTGSLGKIILPELLKEDVDRIILIDVGDVLILRDLSEMYNWNMEGKTFCGTTDMGINRYALVSKKPFDIYINLGHYLVDVKKAKYNKIYDKMVENKNAYTSINYIDQELLNDIADGQIGYLPLKFGINAPYEDDKVSDNPPFKTAYDYIVNVTQKEKYTFLPKNQDEMNAQAFNPVIIHQWNWKWQDGLGLTIYRRIAQYYIKLAGIWDEMYNLHPGYFKKQTP